MNVSTEKLTAWNRFAQLARNTAISARLAYAKGEREKGKQQLAALEEAAAAASVSLEAAGADRPRAARTSAHSVPLELLSTPTSKRYARLMREAYESARQVDYERGYGDDGPADVLEGFVEAAELDAYGPAGMVQD